MIASAVWQRLTGPTHPKRGSTAVAGETVRWRLLRSGTTGEPLMVAVPAPRGVPGTLHYRRFPLDEPFREIAMGREARRSRRPAAHPAPGRQARVLRDARRPAGGTVRIPDGEPVVMRFKGDVPAARADPPRRGDVRLGMMIGVRAALAAALGRPEARRYAWVAVVRDRRSAASCSGRSCRSTPSGRSGRAGRSASDLTDNKTLGMWLAWVGGGRRARGVAGSRATAWPAGRRGRRLRS